MSLLIKLGIDAFSGILNALGGYHWLFLRRYLLPVVLGIAASFMVHIWWVGFMLLPTIGTLCLGYSKDGNFGRALWIGLQCFVLGLGLWLTHHLYWYFYLPYIVGGCVFGGLYRNWPQVIGDYVTGCWMGLIVFLVR